MHHGTLGLALGAIGVLSGPAGLVAAQSFDSFDTFEARDAFRREHPRAIVRAEDDSISRVFGVPLAHGASPAATAEAFLADHAGIFGVEAADLAPAAWDDRGTHVQPLVFDAAANAYRFSVVRYDHHLDGIPVFRSELRLTVRNDAGFPLVSVSNGLKSLDGFQPRAVPGAGAALARAQRNAADAMRAPTAFSDAEAVVWAGLEDVPAVPRLAWVFEATSGSAANPENYQKWLYVVDQATGEVLHRENRILHVDVEGHVGGMATQGIGADICGPEDFEGMPYARVNIGGTIAYADANGDFVIPWGGNTPVTVESGLRGRWFRVFNEAGAETVLSETVTPPGPANFVHNESNTSELVRAEVNAYLHANVVRDFVLAHVPDFPVIGSQTEFPVNVNIASTCNAFYDYQSINFFRSGGGCSNTANSTVVYHEYGHHLVASGGSDQGAYGEGMSDCVAVLITDSPDLGLGFGNNCNQPLRTADNNCQYDPNSCSSCGGEAHSCGRLISGCIWSLREALAVTEPDDYRTILSTLTLSSILLHTGSSITPDIAVDFLVLDDDDGDIYNGTPHRAEILAAFGAHNMAPDLPLIGFEYPNGLPNSIDPSGGTSFVVEVFGIDGTPEPGTGLLHVNLGDGYGAIPMAEIDANVYEATFPAAACGTIVSFYVSAETTLGDLISDPEDAPDVAFSAVSGGVFAFEDNFESDLGWSASGNASTGHWQRGVPADGQRGDPPTDFDGSGRAYLTGNQAGDSDIDNGSVILTSPVLDASGQGDAFVTYARWYDNTFGDSPYSDTFLVEISNDGGASWETLETVGPNGNEVEGGWYHKTFAVGDVLPPTDQVRLRFTASDLGSGSVVEAAVDAVGVYRVVCGGTSLTDVEVVEGTLLSGGLADLTGSDNSTLSARSERGVSAFEPNLLDVVVGAETAVSPADVVSLSIESRINNPGGTAKVRLKNWATGQFEQIDSYTLPLQDGTHESGPVDAADYVRNDGRVEASLRHVVVATFSAVGFDSNFDLVEVTVE